MLEGINQLLNFIIMKKSILNLKGAQELTKNEQKKAIGGKQAKAYCTSNEDCQGGYFSSCNYCDTWSQRCVVVICNEIDLD